MKVAPAGGMSFNGSEFKQSVTELIQEIKPAQIIETGTFLGTGSTKILAEALESNNSPCTFFTIEANSSFRDQAKTNLKAFKRVECIHGLSIPRALLPSREEIEMWLDSLNKEDIYVDFEEYERVECYLREIYHKVPDDFLRICNRYFGYKADLFLLDSSGHLGSIEFNYVLGMQKGRCHFILDDVYHVKHFRSLQMIQSDSRFTIKKLSKEKFGFCIAEYNP